MNRICLALILLSAAVLTGCKALPQAPLAKTGVLDIGGWDFAVNESLPLDGEWEFYWNQLLTPEDFQNKPLKKDFLKIPGIWRGKTSRGEILSPLGYATYRLVLKHPKDTRLKRVRVKSILSTGKIWINGKEAGESGTVGDNKASELPGRFTIDAKFQPEGTETEIILQISNFHNVQGGIGAPIWIGNEKPLALQTSRVLIRTGIICGMFIIIGFHHLVMYALRRVEAENLYFGIYCLVFSVGTLFSDGGGHLINELFPGIPWRLGIDMVFISYAIAGPLIIMLYHSIFPRPRSPIVKRFYQIYGLVFLAYIFATPPNAFGPNVRLFMTVSLFIVPYLGWQFIVDVYRGEKGARMLIPGYVILIAAILNDRLHDAHVINTTILLPFGATFFLLSYSLMISIRTAQAHSSVEKLSHDLEEKNEKLEESVQVLRENVQLKSELEKQKQKEALMKIETEKSVLEMLRYQLNPHFLFNALTSIRGAILKDKDVAREMVVSLSNFYRLTLSSGREDWLAVEQEIQLVELFLKIEKTRLGDYLTVATNIDENVKDLLIPSFTLQPLVENALKYGKLTSPENLDIQINALEKGDYLHLDVINSGSWFDSTNEDNTQSTGIGLVNLQNRMEKLYPGDYTFKTDAKDGKVKVQLEITMTKLKKSDSN